MEYGVRRKQSSATINKSWPMLNRAQGSLNEISAQIEIAKRLQYIDEAEDLGADMSVEAVEKVLGSQTHGVKITAS